MLDDNEKLRSQIEQLEKENEGLKGLCERLNVEGGRQTDEAVKNLQGLWEERETAWRAFKDAVAAMDVDKSKYLGRGFVAVDQWRIQRDAAMLLAPKDE